MNDPQQRAGKAGNAMKLIGCIVIVIINEFLALASFDPPKDEHPDIARTILIADLSFPILFPLLVVLLMQIGKRFRNATSRINIFLVTSLLLLIGSLGGLASN